jgi:flagellar FliL protein
MAETEQAAEGEEASGGGNKKLIIIFAIVLLVAVGGSVAGTLFLLGGDEEAVAEEEASPVPTKAIYHELRPAFVVNYVISGKPRYLQTELSVMSRYPAAIDAVIAHAPLVRARVLSYLTDQSFTDLQTEEGKRALQEGLAGLLNDIVSEHGAEGGVETVLFSSFVMQ